jgi:signal transduction histidine kinase
MGALTSFVFSYVLPLFTKADDRNQALILLTFTQKDESILYLSAFLFSFLSGGFFLSQYFVKPLLFILSLVSQLSQGNYDLKSIRKEVYKKEKLKRRYFLYKEILADLFDLSDILETVKTERTQLETSKRNWVKGISHDLKTPLSYIIGYSALLKNNDYVWEKEESLRFLDEIYGKGKYIEQLVEDMNLVYSMQTYQTGLPIDKNSFDIIPYLQKLVADISNAPNADNYIFSFSSKEKEFFIKADPKLLHRAFQNLLVNALQHNPEGTSIAVIVSKSKQDTIIITITDNGKGLASEIKDKFNDNSLFPTEETGYRKDGLGLSIVKSIIKAHNGSVIVQSLAETGTTFTVTLPL